MENIDLKEEAAFSKEEIGDFEKELDRVKAQLEEARSQGGGDEELREAYEKQKARADKLKKALDSEIENHKEEVNEIEAEWEAEVRKLKEKLLKAREASGGGSSSSNTVACPECKAENRATRKFCKDCGEELA